MTGFDLTPLFRSTVGFDRLNRLLDAATRVDESVPSYPPYNIERSGDDAYRVTIAVAGFGEDDINITVKENALIVQGKLADKDDEARYLHRGIAGRVFERRFQLADHIVVKGARLENGLLSVDLERDVPEALRPRTIPIQTKAIGRRKAA